MSTIARGNAAEAAVLLALVEAGVPAYLPFGEGSPFDLVAVTPDDRLLRVQVKAGRVRNGSVLFNSCSTDHGRGRQHYRGRADVFAVYVALRKEIFIVAVDECPGYVARLRLESPRNNQRVGIRFAADHTFERWIASMHGSAAAA